MGKNRGKAALLSRVSKSALRECRQMFIVKTNIDKVSYIVVDRLISYDITDYQANRRIKYQRDKSSSFSHSSANAIARKSNRILM